MDFLFVIILGGLWGSFANVCIYRLPLNKGVVSGRSYCPKCKKQITLKDNIPYFLFIVKWKMSKMQKTNFFSIYSSRVFEHFIFYNYLFFIWNYINNSIVNGFKLIFHYHFFYRSKALHYSK